MHVVISLSYGSSSHLFFYALVFLMSYSSPGKSLLIGGLATHMQHCLRVKSDGEHRSLSGDSAKTFLEAAALAWVCRNHHAERFPRLEDASSGARRDG